MQVLTDSDATDVVDDGVAVTIGAYDGVHVGHRAIIRRVRDLAATQGLATAVVTFDRHPAAVVRPESAPFLLTDRDQKLELLAETGVDYTYVVHFDEARAKEEPESFVRDVLVDRLGARSVVVGEDFHFGHRRRGNVTMLTDLGHRYGFEVTGLPLVGLDGQRARDHAQVSSTAIRRALAQGHLAAANRMLGRPYEVRGVVGHGDERGRELGFPTANVAVPAEILLPADGVYAGWYTRPDGSVHRAAISLGTRPTFYADDGALLLEAYLLDFSGDLYDEAARVRFVDRLRPQVRLDGVDALIEQLRIDVEDTRVALTG